MESRFLLCIFGSILVLLATCESRNVEKEESTLEDARREYMSKWNTIAKLYQEDSKMKRAINFANWYHHQMNKGNLDDPRPPPIDIPSKAFTCNPDYGISPLEPQTVHELKPGDISVVAAFGDSITAGNGLGAENALLVAVENRGESWSVGGDFSLELNVSSLPNMIRKYNPDLKGHSACTGGEGDVEYSWLNVAVPGARATHMPEQAEDMIFKMKNDERIEYAMDWKVITLFIGGNDLCSYCENRDSRSPADYIGHIQEALDMLHTQVPRAFVNLVPMSEVGFVKDVYFHYGNTSYPGEPDPAGLYPFLCDVLHQVFCPCVMNETTRAEQKTVQMEYFRLMDDLVNSGRYDTKDDFTVVLQPFARDAVGMKDPITGMTDSRYFAPDCFHPNRRLHQVLAFALWNSMLTKVGQKPTGTDPYHWTEYVCPTDTANNYLYTNFNSAPTPEPEPPSSASSFHAVVMTTLSLLGAVFLGMNQ